MPPLITRLVGRRLGDAPPRTPWRVRLGMRPKPQYLRFLNLDQFNWNEASLTPRLRQMVGHLAKHVQLSWKSMQPIGFIRLIGHTDNTGPEKYNVDLGVRRARAVKDELENILREDILKARIRIAILVEPSPGASAPTADNKTREGRALNRRVEVFIAPPELPPPPPAPSRPVRIPTPEEAARAVVPLGPETPEERIRRILTRPPPTPPPRRSFSEMFWRRVDERLNSTMRRIGVSPSLWAYPRCRARGDSTGGEKGS